MVDARSQVGLGLGGTIGLVVVYLVAVSVYIRADVVEVVGVLYAILINIGGSHVVLDGTSGGLYPSGVGNLA